MISAVDAWYDVRQGYRSSRRLKIQGSMQGFAALLLEHKTWILRCLWTKGEPGYDMFCGEHVLDLERMARKKETHKKRVGQRNLRAS